MKKSKLNDKEFGHLYNHATFGGLARRMPEEIEDRLVENGYIKKGLGGHILTDKGMMILSNGGRE